MIFTLGSNPVAEAIGRAAEPRLGQVLRSHSMPGQKTTHLELLTLASAGTAPFGPLHMHVESGETCVTPRLEPCLPKCIAFSSTTITYYG